MAYNWYPVSSIIGGMSGSLDSIDGSILQNDDRATVITDYAVFFYILDADSGLAENFPDIIAPDLNAGPKRWILVNIIGNLSGGLFNTEVSKDDLVAGDIDDGNITPVINSSGSVGASQAHLPERDHIFFYSDASDIVYDTANNQFLFLGRSRSTNYPVRFCRFTVDGTNVTSVYDTSVTWYGNEGCGIGYNSTTNTAVCLYNDSYEGEVRIKIADMSTGVPSFGSAITVASYGTSQAVSLAVDPNSALIAVVYKNFADSNRIYVRCGEISGTTVTFGTAYRVYLQEPAETKVIFDPRGGVGKRVLVVWRYWGYFRCRYITFNETTLDVSSGSATYTSSLRTESMSSLLYVPTAGAAGAFVFYALEGDASPYSDNMYVIEDSGSDPTDVTMTAINTSGITQFGDYQAICKDENDTIYLFLRTPSDNIIYRTMTCESDGTVTASDSSVVLDTDGESIITVLAAWNPDGNSIFVGYAFFDLALDSAYTFILDFSIFSNVVNLIGASTGDFSSSENGTYSTFGSVISTASTFDPGVDLYIQSDLSIGTTITPYHIGTSLPNKKIILNGRLFLGKFFCPSITGDSFSSLDAIDGTFLKENMEGFVKEGRFLSHYILKESGVIGSSPYVVSPINNAGTKKWVRVNNPTLMLTESTSDGNNTITEGNFSSVLNGYSNSINDLDLNSNDYGKNCIFSGQNNEIRKSILSSIGFGAENILWKTNRAKAEGLYSFGTNYSQLVRGGGRFNHTTLGIGEIQESKFILSGETTDGTQSEILLADGTSKVYLKMQKLCKFIIELSAFQSGGSGGTVGDSAFWSISGAIKNVGASIAQGLITMSDSIPTEGDTFVFNGDTYTLTGTVSDVYTDIDISSGNTETIANNIAMALNYRDDVFLAVASFSSPNYEILITADPLLGASPNSWVFTESSTVLTFDGSGTFGGTQAGADGTVSLVGTPQGVGVPGANDSDVGATAWSVAVSADDTNKALKIDVTGETDKTIHWVANIILTEVA